MGEKPPPTPPENEERPAPRGKKRWLIGGSIFLLSAALLWEMRMQIIEGLVADQLSRREVQASYRIEAIGPRTQRIADVIIGDPADPDLIARTVEIDVRWGWTGPSVSAIRARDVRAHARWDGQRLRLGEVDKLLPPPSDEPLQLPDINLTLDDARARIETPWGAVGARLDGSGALQRSFGGSIALMGRDLALESCSGGQINAFGRILVDRGALRFSGPLRGQNLRCSKNQMVLDRADMVVDAKLSADFQRWSGTLDGSANRLRAGIARVGTITLTGGFDGGSSAASFTYNLATTDVSAPDGRVKTATLVGDGKWAAGALSGGADVRINGAALAQAQRAKLQRALSASSANDFGRLANNYGSATVAALGDLSASGRIGFASEKSGVKLDLTNLSVKSRSGMSLSPASGSKVDALFGDQGLRWSLNGRWQLAGGGLPAAVFSGQRNQNGVIDGQLTIAPLVAGTTRVALDPIRFSVDPRGIGKFASRALFSGRFGGVSVDGLSFDMRADRRRDGSIALNGGCQSLRWNNARFVGLVLAPTRTRVCSAPGQPLLTWNNGRLAGQLLLPTPQLRGWTGESPFAADAERARYSLASGDWSVEGLKVSVGSDEAATNFSASTITGLAEFGGLGGRLEGAEGEIGTIPLDMRDIAGDWRWENAILRLNGGLSVSDQAQPRRFNPLQSKDAVLEFANGAITATANFAEMETQTQIGKVDLRHDFDVAAGSADLLIMSMRFNQRFQPDQLTPLALGVVANTEGTLAGRGRIDWSGSEVTSTGTFTTAGSDFAAAFGSVRGASTTLVFDDLLAVRSAPDQRISFDEINPGFPVIGGTISYELLDANRIQINGGRWPFAGGELLLRPTTLDFDVNAVRRLEFELVGVDAAVFLTELGFQNISASGVFDGILPVEFSGLGGRIVNGKLVARKGGGGLAYVGELTNYNLGVMANFAFNMLKSLKYEQMEINLNGDLDGEMLTDVRFEGLSQGEGASRNIITRQIEKLPIVFNVKINAPFRQLISSAKSLYDPTALIDQNLFTLIRAQREAENKPVQPPESDSVP